MSTTVVTYTDPACPHCRRLKQHLTERGISFTDRDVTTDREAQAELDLEVLAALAGKTIILGVIALDSDEVESAETVAERIRRALPYTTDLVAAPDCGMKYLPRATAFAKLCALADAACSIRAELSA